MSHNSANSNASQPSATDRHYFGRHRLRGVLIGAACVGVLMCGVAFLLHGKMGLEKSLTSFSMPVGMIWLLLCGWVLQAFASRTLTSILFSMLICGVFSACALPILPAWAIRYLETRETPFDPTSDPPLDVLVVLGGATAEAPGRAQLRESGDRVMYAAELYQQGFTDKLLTTGSAMAGLGGAARRSPAEQTIEIWTKLGIPAADISTLPGHNTFEEMQSLQELETQQLAGKRIGLLTSAWHLPRAMRLARSQGLDDIVPVAANYLSRYDAATFLDYFPSAYNLDKSTYAQREFMAQLLGR